MTTTIRRAALYAVMLSLAFLPCSCGTPGEEETHRAEEKRQRARLSNEEEGESRGRTTPPAAEGEAAEHTREESGGEGRVALSPEAIASARIETAEAGPHAIRLRLDLPGEIVPNAERVARIVPRFPGIATEVRKALGDPVEKGEVLAVIESNESLAPYEVRSLIAGTVIAKRVVLGEFAKDDTDMFVVADLSTVWVAITVYARDLGQVCKGQRVDIAVVGGGPAGASTIDYIAPVLGESARAATARAVLANPASAWRPGMFVTARVLLDETPAAVSVRSGAIQNIDDKPVVFVAEGDAFVPRPVELGRTDGEWAEIVSGLSAGDRYVTRGAFVLKSELRKSEMGDQD